MKLLRSALIDRDLDVLAKQIKDLMIEVPSTVEHDVNMRFKIIRYNDEKLDFYQLGKFGYDSMLYKLPVAACRLALFYSSITSQDNLFMISDVDTAAVLEINLKSVRRARATLEEDGIIAVYKQRTSKQPAMYMYNPYICHSCKKERVRFLESRWDKIISDDAQLQFVQLKHHNENYELTYTPLKEDDHYSKYGHLIETSSKTKVASSNKKEPSPDKTTQKHSDNAQHQGHHNTDYLQDASDFSDIDEVFANEELSDL